MEAGARREQIDQAEAAVQQAKAAVVKARRDAERAEQLFAAGAIAKQQWDAAVSQRDSAEAALAAAEARLAELKGGARPEEKEQARAAEALARAQLEGARLTYETIRQLYADRLTAKQQVQTAKTQYETALKQVAAARARLDLLLAGATREAVSAARGQVQQALGALTAAKATAANLVVRSPVSGTVILKSLEQGEMAAPGMPIVRVANLDSVWVRVYVPLPQLRVRIGDTAHVTVDAYPGRKFPGRVAEVADKPEFTPKNVQTKDERVKLVFGVKIELNNPKHELKPGMPADAEIRVR
ncbi:MAG: HlyD family secretion protein [Armatimonadota bacterium]